MELFIKISEKMFFSKVLPAKDRGFERVNTCESSNGFTILVISLIFSFEIK